MKKYEEYTFKTFVECEEGCSCVEEEGCSCHDCLADEDDEMDSYTPEEVDDVIEDVEIETKKDMYTDLWIRIEMIVKNINKNSIPKDKFSKVVEGLQNLKNEMKKDIFGEDKP